MHMGVAGEVTVGSRRQRRESARQILSVRIYVAGRDFIREKKGAETDCLPNHDCFHMLSTRRALKIFRTSPRRLDWFPRKAQSS